MSRTGEEDPRDPLSAADRDYWLHGGTLPRSATFAAAAMGSSSLSYDEHSLLRWIHELSGKLAQSVRSADPTLTSTVLEAIDELHAQAQRVIDLATSDPTGHHPN